MNSPLPFDPAVLPIAFLITLFAFVFGPCFLPMLIAPVVALIRGHASAARDTFWVDHDLEASRQLAMHNLAAQGFHEDESSDPLKIVCKREWNSRRKRTFAHDELPIKASMQFEPHLSGTIVSVTVSCLDWIVKDTGETAYMRNIADELIVCPTAGCATTTRDAAPVPQNSLALFHLIRTAGQMALLLPIAMILLRRDVWLSLGIMAGTVLAVPMYAAMLHIGYRQVAQNRQKLGGGRTGVTGLIMLLVSVALALIVFAAVHHRSILDGSLRQSFHESFQFETPPSPPAVKQTNHLAPKKE